MLTLAEAPSLEVYMKAVCFGLVGIRNGYLTHYLQSYVATDGRKDGELHCSNPHRNEEETWYLIDLKEDDVADQRDASGERAKLYAFVNYRNTKFLSAKSDGCARADEVLLTQSEKWALVSGFDAGVQNGFALRSAATRHYLGATRENTPCGGEVGCGTGSASPVPPPRDNLTEYNGWWTIEPAEKPTPGEPTVKTISEIVLKAVPLLVSLKSLLSGIGGGSGGGGGR